MFPGQPARADSYVFTSRQLGSGHREVHTTAPDVFLPNTEDLSLTRSLTLTTNAPKIWAMGGHVQHRHEDKPRTEHIPSGR